MVCLFTYEKERDHNSVLPTQLNDANFPCYTLSQRKPSFVID